MNVALIFLASALLVTYCVASPDGNIACPVGWRHYAPTSKCFKFIHEVTFDEAVSECKRMNGSLSSIHGKDENDFVRDTCLESYIDENGDYYFAENCRCYDPCEDTSHNAQVNEANWPEGDFFYGPYCPQANGINFTDCQQFYSDNAMTLQVSFAQLGFEMLSEEPVTSVWALLNNMAGNTGLWLGYTMISLTECLLIALQIGLWVCRCPKELPEVPSCRYRNFLSDEEEEKMRENGGLDDSDAPSHKNELTVPKVSVVRKVSSWHGMAPKNFNNSLYDDDSADFRSSLPDLEAMRRRRSNSSFELVIPVIAESCPFEGSVHMTIGQ